MDETRTPFSAGSARATSVAELDEGFLGELRRQMLKFATLQLSNPQAAEDAVQEALAGAMKNASTFAGRSAFKTWVFAILKNKVADELRRRQRLVEASQLLREDEEEEGEWFDQQGFWLAQELPRTWQDPEDAFQNAQFWQVFEACLDHLPARQARVFMMREFLGLESHEICTSLGITATNLNVMLHRARLRLRECLENRWFSGGKPC